MQTTQTTTKTCGRCGGSGRYSFNLVRGTVCFRCDGAGVVTVNVAAEEKKAARVAERNAVELARREQVLAALAEVVTEMNAVYGPFDVTTVLGMEGLNNATFRATGKTCYQHRDERLKA